ncbi:MAG TPA: tRNA (adenosine(37)-N6)-threonylcarbamoyltransferase complex transferase subunit TsaD [Anaerohalosphaeraceae bacterium]|nr:tRNA (adenosine(37)-N6)-threonylcarbamoyltransferase complex transferase subunit TsaD [Anaerohalosphaeraceae bacterium]HOL31111.1 tRNA (adenosine(37)-N6)-threonylcarbamoyltransferase complex transferase subunit TsaD [Anaerohalosphaeraceae bacterium]HOM74911.1 tRNA (adenosine(37)-N6)-threonylcarbamoyltransferase complex transferase subunit TsaD [Anaerohalosphaeraceae bacterium]HPC63874.1 tRNA (adenosine(37)-N6)-threonylcarbamoyltransferase complex transferase subunit TsaD [Anaerohalosphaeracea
MKGTDLAEQGIHILGIETSCDETAAAVVANGRQIKSSVVASQTALHEQYGGVVPEIASRAHVENILPVIEKAIQQACIEPSQIDAVAVASQPGLAIALMVGVTAAKTLAFAWGKPLIAVNHVHAHLQSAILEQESIELPAVALIVSGGHTNLYDAESALDLRLLGRTIDDAAGEAFDKVASILGLPYPGGPSIEKIAKEGNPKAIRFPRSLMQKDNLNFSFSGLKTAVLYHCRGQDMKGQNRAASMSRQETADIAASFQAAVVEVLVRKTRRAARQIGAKTVLLGGGVACNSALRQAMEAMCSREHLTLLIAPKQLCTDNAVMVASLAYYKYQAKQFAGLDLEPSATA